MVTVTAQPVSVSSCHFYSERVLSQTAREELAKQSQLQGLETDPVLNPLT